MLTRVDRRMKDVSAVSRETAVIQGVTERLTVDFRGALPQTLIRSYVMEVFPTLSHVNDRAELEDILHVITTFRLAAVEDSLSHTSAHPLEASSRDLDAGVG